jgi:hypothetical protein
MDNIDKMTLTIGEGNEIFRLRAILQQQQGLTFTPLRLTTTKRNSI